MPGGFTCDLSEVGIKIVLTLLLQRFDLSEVKSPVDVGYRQALEGAPHASLPYTYPSLRASLSRLGRS